MRVAKQSAAGVLARLKVYVRRLGARVYGCVRRQDFSLGEIGISYGPDAAPRQENPWKDSLPSNGSDDEDLASFDMITHSMFAADSVDDDCSGTVMTVIHGVGLHGTFTDAVFDAEPEADASLATITATIDVPWLDPDSKQRPAGADLLQQAPCSSAWVAPLWAPITDAGGDVTWQQQRMLVKIHRFYSDELAAEVRAAAAGARNSAKQKKVCIPTERDAMSEVRMAVKLACTSVRRIRGAASPSGPPPSPAAVGDSSPGSGIAGSGQPMLPVHLEVRPCVTRRRGKGGGPDWEVVAVYPYHPPLAAGAAEELPAEPRA